MLTSGQLLLGHIRHNDSSRSNLKARGHQLVTRPRLRIRTHTHNAIRSQRVLVAFDDARKAPPDTSHRLQPRLRHRRPKPHPRAPVPSQPRRAIPITAILARHTQASPKHPPPRDATAHRPSRFQLQAPIAHERLRHPRHPPHHRASVPECLSDHGHSHHLARPDAAFPLSFPPKALHGCREPRRALRSVLRPGAQCRYARQIQLYLQLYQPVSCHERQRHYLEQRG